jgi:hypothetical protein
MKPEATKVSVELAGGKQLSIETGKLAKQAHGAAVVRFGENVVLATATSNPDPREGIDFFPLTVDYREYTYAGGRIPGGFIKREGRMSEREMLTSRQIDRPIRPMFAEGFKCETQVIAFVLSADTENDPDVCGINAASAALTISDIPFLGPLGAVRVGLIDGRFHRQSHLHRDARRPAQHHGRRHRRCDRHDRVGRERSQRRDGGGRDRIRAHRNQEDLRRHQRAAQQGRQAQACQVTPPEFDEAYFKAWKRRSARAWPTLSTPRSIRRTKATNWFAYWKRTA